jgi:AraC-like DNA-binding protein
MNFCYILPLLPSPIDAKGAANIFQGKNLTRIVMEAIMSKFVVLVLGASAFLKEKLEKASTDEWRPLFVRDFDEAMRIMKHTPVSCFVAGPYAKGKDGATKITQFCRQFETVPAILYDVRLQVLDLLEEITAAIKHQAFQPEVKVFGIDLEPCSKRIKKAIRMMLDEFRENIMVDEIAHRLGVHRSHLEREWHQECGSITAKQLLIGLKLHYATFIIRNEGLKLKDIARLAGFANEHEFYRSFHRHMGIIASRYRKDYTFADFGSIYWDRQRTKQ